MEQRENPIKETRAHRNIFQRQGISVSTIPPFLTNPLSTSYYVIEPKISTSTLFYLKEEINCPQSLFSAIHLASQDFFRCSLEWLLSNGMLQIVQVPVTHFE